MARFTKKEICEILKNDWTIPNAPKVHDKDFLKSQYILNAGFSNFFNQFKIFMAFRKGYISDLSPEAILAGINRLEPRDYQIDIEKGKILKFLHYLESKHCYAAKICFGMDKTVETGGQVQMINSGSFWEVLRKNSRTPNYSKTLDHIFKINGDIEFRLNFGENSESNNIISSYFVNFHHFLTNTEPNVSMGYVIGIKNYISLFTKNEFLGNATNISFQFGMNSSGISDISGSQYMMINITSPEVPDKSYCLFDTDIVDNDSMGCPPRPPCNT
jgi:hypothetical protein